ncbi:RHS repeat domain-containing protein [Asticcacaulis tiandongensis]|uniref:RHS repeat domain-containing protein n=1 Tax=Asticcacaulis tiandongensis TaxID=2565365 RepID=UPI00112C81E0|nr:RHS repeat domain-containing protein [Asticcacaulis tiandongensis]
MSAIGNSLARLGAFNALILLAGLVPGFALANTAPSKGLMIHSPNTTDENGVDLGTGQFVPPKPMAQIGSGQSSLTETSSGALFPIGSNYKGGITLVDRYSPRTYEVYANHTNKDDGVVHVYFNGYSKIFEWSWSENRYIAQDGSADTLAVDPMAMPGQRTSGAILTTSDGTKVEFGPHGPYDFGVDAIFTAASKIIKPDGEVIGIQYEDEYIHTGFTQGDHFPQFPPYYYTKGYLRTVHSSLGWKMFNDNKESSAYKLGNIMVAGTGTYVWIGSSDHAKQWQPLQSYIPYPTSDPRQEFYKEKHINTLSFSGMGNYYKYKEFTERRWSQMCNVANFVVAQEYVAADHPYWDRVDEPGECYTNLEMIFKEKEEIYSVDNKLLYTVQYAPLPNNFTVYNNIASIGGCYGLSVTVTCVQSVTRAGQTWTYNWSKVSGSHHYQVDIEDPAGNHRIVVTTHDYRLGTRIISDTDGLGRKTSYQYDGQYRLTRVTYPENNYTIYEYDTRGNLKFVRSYPKIGTTPIVTEASYPLSCTEATAKVCNKPVWVRDALGNQTDYTYDPAHGGVLTETGPADANGVRPQTRYAYTPFPPSFSIYSVTPDIWRLIKISTCLTATTANPASCVGTVNEQIKEYAYAHPNLLLTSETVRNGNSTVSVTTSYTYDHLGNTVIVDGPRTDVDDRIYKTYDAQRRPLLEIGAEPDGNGALKRPTVKHYYDLDGLETRTETGTCGTVTMSGGMPTGCSDFVWTSAKKMTYDAVGRLTKTEVMQP